MKVLMTAQRVPKLTGKYLFSVDPNNVTTESSGYVGKLRSNVFGSFYNLYDNGDDPSMFFTQKRPRINILSINYVQKTHKIVINRSLDY